MKIPPDWTRLIVYHGIHGSRAYRDEFDWRGVVSRDALGKAYTEGRRLAVTGFRCERDCPICHGVKP